TNIKYIHPPGKGYKIGDFREPLPKNQDLLLIRKRGNLLAGQFLYNSRPDNRPVHARTLEATGVN
ncbi:MAG: hypothetical protein WBB64_03505, partial [Anaerolineales bacterium]